MQTIDLPNGGRAEFLDVDDISGRKRKDFFNLIRDKDPADTPTYGIAFFIVSWSLEQPLPDVTSPTSLNMLEELPVRVYDAMQLYMVKLIKAITPNFEPDPNPASPTLPSGA